MTKRAVTSAVLCFCTSVAFAAEGPSWTLKGGKISAANRMIECSSSCALTTDFSPSVSLKAERIVADPEGGVIRLYNSISGASGDQRPDAAATSVTFRPDGQVVIYAESPAKHP